MTRLPSVLDTRDLPLAELCALRLDGELFTVGSAWSPIDEPNLASQRAASIRDWRGRDLIFERYSAAWVLGAPILPPIDTQYCVSVGARVGVEIELNCSVREVRLAPDDVTRVGGDRCTSPARTAYDLLRDASTDDAQVNAAVRGLLALDSAVVASVHRRLSEPDRRAHKVLARRRLADLLVADAAAQPSLMRYTS